MPVMCVIDKNTYDSIGCLFTFLFLFIYFLKNAMWTFFGVYVWHMHESVPVCVHMPVC